MRKFFWCINLCLMISSYGILEAKPVAISPVEGHELPTTTAKGTSYDIQYKVTVNPTVASASSFTIITATKGTGATFAEKTPCTLDSNRTCIWDGTFVPNTSGSHSIYMTYKIGSVSYTSGSSSQSTTTGQAPPPAEPLEVSLDDPSFDSLAVKRIKVTNASPESVSNFVIDDSGLEMYFEHYSGGDSKWCDTSTCTQRCQQAEQGHSLGGGQSCYIYLYATDKAVVQHPHQSSLTISGNGHSTVVNLTNTGLLYAAGAFTDGTDEYVAKYNGATWGNIEKRPGAIKFNGTINALAIDSRGNVYAGGAFTDGTNEYIAK